MNEEKKALDIYPIIGLTVLGKDIEGVQRECKGNFNTRMIQYGTDSKGKTWVSSDLNEQADYVKETSSEIALKIHEMNEIHMRHKAEIERDVNMSACQTHTLKPYPVEPNDLTESDDNATN